MKIARASRVAIVWAMCLQLLVAPLAVAIESYVQNNDPPATPDKADETIVKSEGTNYQDDKLTTDDVDSKLVDSNDVNNTTITQSFSESPSKSDDEIGSDDGVVVDDNDQSGIIITQVQTTGGSGRSGEDLIELRNNSNRQIDITGWLIQYTNSAGNNSSTVATLLPAETTLGWRLLLPPGAYYLLSSDAFAGHDDNKGIAIDQRFITLLATVGGRLLVYDSLGTLQTGFAWGAAVEAPAGSPFAPVSDVMVRKMIDATWHQDTGDNLADFTGIKRLIRPATIIKAEEVFDACLNIDEIQKDLPEGLYRNETTGYCSDVPPPPPPQVNQCEGLVLSEIGANLSEQFIEIHNPSDETLELGGCRLLTNRSDTKYHAFDDEQLAAGAYKSVVVPQEADLTLTKTTSGTVYLVSEDGLLEVDSVSYANLRADTSWALVGEEWYQTYSPTPGEPNIYEQFLPCEEGYVRNTETGRCIKIIVLGEAEPCAANQYRNPDTGRCRLIDVGSTLTPCRDDQYRHPETNRCRSLESTASTLVPCGEGQERNPETNRCRAIASAANSLTPCQEGQERNPETNRCRKIASLTTLTDFPVEPIVDTSKGFAAWWTLGGVTLLGVGYGAWEWRRELAAGMRRVGGMMSK